MSQRVAASLVAAALLLLAACGSRPPRSTPASGVGQPQPFTHFVAPLPPSFTGVLAQARHYSSQQIDLLPPPPSMQPLTSPAEAFQTCWSEAPCVANRSPEILLALYTNRSFGHIEADGSVIYPHQDVLAYVMTWRNVPAVAAGSSLSKGPTNVANVDHVVLVDANSGRPLLALETAPFEE